MVKQLFRSFLLSLSIVGACLACSHNTFASSRASSLIINEHSPDYSPAIDQDNLTITVQSGDYSFPEDNLELIASFGIERDTIGNRVVLEAGSPYINKLVGGFSFLTDAKEHSVILQSGAQVGTLMGGFSSTGTAHSSKLFLVGATVQQLAAGTVESGTVWGNTAHITAGSIVVTAVGGMAEEGISRNNSVEIEDSQVTTAYGGQSTHDGSANNNKVSITGDSTVTTAIGGIVNRLGDATANMVHLAGVSVVQLAIGAKTESGRTTGNTVVLTDFSQAQTIYGGQSLSHVVEGNHVSLQDNARAGIVVGGEALNRISQENSVSLTGNAHATTIIGGRGTNSIGNSVSITGGTYETVYAGFAIAQATGMAQGNSIEQTAGRGLSLMGGYAATQSRGNIVTVSGGQVDGSIYGGWVWNDGLAEQNSIVLAGGTIIGDVIASRANSGTARDSSVTVAGATIQGRIIGGYSEDGLVAGNTVRLGEGAKVQGDVYAAYVTGTGQAYDNSIVLHGTTADLSLTTLWGSNQSINTAGSVLAAGENSAIFRGFSGRIHAINNMGTVAIDADSTVQIREIYPTLYNVHNDGVFSFADGTAAGLLWIKERYSGHGIIDMAINFGEDADVAQIYLDDNAIVHDPLRIRLKPSGKPVDWQKMVIVASNIARDPNLVELVSHKYGVYAFEMKAVENQWVVVADMIDAVPGTAHNGYSRDLAKPYAASMTAATDVLHSSTNHALRAFQEHQTNLKPDFRGTSEFSSNTGTNSHYAKGSELNASTISNVTGSLWTGEASGFGFFLESGFMSYTADSGYKISSEQGDLYSEGMVVATGAGLFGYWDYGAVRIDHLLHLGWQKISFSAPDISLSQADTNRWFAAVGTGISYLPYENDAQSIAVRAGVTYTHALSHNMLDSLDQEVNFGALHMWHTSLNARYTRKFDPDFSLYVEAGIDHGLAGEQKIHIDDQRAPDPELIGLSYNGEVGMHWKVMEDIAIGTGVQGALGFHKSYGVNLNLQWEF